MMTVEIMKRMKVKKIDLDKADDKTHSVCEVGFDVMRLGVTPSTWTPCPISTVSLAWRFLAPPKNREDDLSSPCNGNTCRLRALSAHRLIVTYVFSGTAPFFPYGTFNIVVNFHFHFVKQFHPVADPARGRGACPPLAAWQLFYRQYINLSLIHI